MAELNLNQIIERLNAEFSGETRKLVFWYDDKAQFAEDILTVTLENAEIYQLRPDNQFYTKWFLERKDTTTNYLIYAPFPKPDVKDNHLEDTMLYSKRFFADRASLLCVDLSIDEKYKPLLERHIKFFDRKERTQRFYDLEIENFTEENILVGLMSAICKTKSSSFEEVVRVLLTDGTLTDNKYLAEMDRYALVPAFWKLCEQQFGYTDSKPSLEKMLVTLFVTYAKRSLHCDVPDAWKTFVSYKSGNIIAFMDSLMNSILYREKYDELSEHIAAGLKAESAFASMQPEDLADCDAFRCVDRIIIQWVVDRLIAEDVGAKLNDLSIMQLCDKRMKLHFGEQTRPVYMLLRSACLLISSAKYSCPDGFKAIIDQYTRSDCLIDTEYRKFYYYYDGLEEKDEFDALRTLVENIYTNEYLSTIVPKWTKALQTPDALDVIHKQREFFRNHVKYAIRDPRERVVVIISDALRYEVARELFLRLADDPKCTAKLEVQLSVLPSYTRLGMASLLPHQTLTMTDDFKVLVDDVLCDSLAARQKVLQKYVPNSACIQYDDISSLTQTVLRNVIPGNNVVYIYHNQIDARGDEAKTEDEVFAACEEAVNELYALVRALSSKANTQHCIITADHGFIYKRDKLDESDKIDGISNKDSFVNRRFVVSRTPVETEGVAHLSMGQVLGNEDEKIVSFPVGSNVFKVPGGGQNYVHGGSSPQEMLVPVIDVKTEKAAVSYTNVQIALVSMLRKITNLIVTVDFIQSEPISDTQKETTYRMYFISEDNERISNEVLHVADSREKDAQKRIFRERFTFKNKKYDKNKQYYLVVCDDNDELGGELFRHPVIMDIAFADDFGF